MENTNKEIENELYFQVKGLVIPEGSFTQGNIEIKGLQIVIGMVLQR